MPATLTAGQTVNIGSGGERPNRLESGELDSPTPDRCDTCAFVVPANFTHGNSGVNILTGDMMRVYDFSILKNFRPTESTRVQFRTEFFNLPNTPSFNNLQQCRIFPERAGDQYEIPNGGRFSSV